MRPRLRPVEVLRVPVGDGRLGTLLRDAEGVAPHSVTIAPPHDAAVPLFDGTRDVEGIARALARRGVELSVQEVGRLALELEQAVMLEGPRAARRRHELVEQYRRARVRPAQFAGASYHADEVALERFIVERCLGAVKAPTAPQAPERVCAVISPHMDLWRAAEGYGHAYTGVAEAAPDDLDTIVVLGTCHVGMESAFAFSRHDFATPLGVARPDRELVAEVGRRSGIDLLADEYKHKGEHSIEFQILFLQHVLGRRAAQARFVPVLCGLGRAQERGIDPSEEEEANRALVALKEALRGRSVLVVAGADLAHVGPRFGDKALDPQGRARLAARDRDTLTHVEAGRGAAFFHHTNEDQATRRVCGVGPIFTLLALLPEGARGRLRQYTQHVDPEEGSIVSHAAVHFELPK